MGETHRAGEENQRPLTTVFSASRVVPPLVKEPTQLATYTYIDLAKPRFFNIYCRVNAYNETILRNGLHSCFGLHPSYKL